MEGSVIRALEWDGQFHALTFADWVTVTPGEATEGLLQQVAVTLGVTANEGQERAADLFLFPASMADAKVEDICNPNNCSEFNEPYAKYYIGRLTQKGVPMPFMTMSYPSDYLEAEGVFFTNLQATEEANIMQWDLGGAESYHKLTYTGQWSYESANFSISKSFATCKFYEDTQYPEGFFTKEITPDWIEFWANPDKSMGKFNMLYTPASPIHIAAVFFDENGGKVAAVLVEYNPAGGGSSAATLSVVNGEATVETLPAESDIVQWLGSELSVSTVFAVNANSAETVFQFSQSIAMASALTTTLAPSSAVTLQTEGEYFGVTATESVEVIIVLKDANNMNLAAIYYTYTKPAGGGSLISSSTTGVSIEEADVTIAEVVNTALNGAIGVSAPSVLMVTSSAAEAYFTHALTYNECITAEFVEGELYPCEDIKVIRDSDTSFTVTTELETCERLLIFLDNTTGEVSLAVYYCKSNS